MMFKTDASASDAKGLALLPPASLAAKSRSRAASHWLDEPARVKASALTRSKTHWVFAGRPKNKIQSIKNSLHALIYH